MEAVFNHLVGKKLQPKDVLPAITAWICEKGTGQQLIDWVNGLEGEKEAIFRALNSCSAEQEGEMEAVDDGGSHEASPVRECVQAKPNEGSANRIIPIS
nr:V2 protein [Apple geminivirus]